ncbi:MAG: hypothetical protein NC399_02845 [Muribaculum sp.]|nr:hypothetical protein [Muribaculum sp.]
MYTKVSCSIRNRMEILKYYDIRYGAPGMPRQARRKKTPEEMARQNLWQRTRKLRRLIELNFEAGDWHVTLTCRPGERPDPEDAPAVIRKFRDKLRNAFKRQGWELKYIITCETGQRGAVHWHMIVNDCHNDRESTAAIIRRLWIRGRPYFSPLDESGEYGVLAEYIIKETADRITKDGTIEKLSYIPSRNLRRPVEKREKIPARRWREEPKPPKGWELVKGSLMNGVNKYSGLPYQHYTLRRLGKEERDADSGHLYRDKHPGGGKRRRQNLLRHQNKDIPEDRNQPDGPMARRGL